jgi:hypothetical protein
MTQLHRCFRHDIRDTAEKMNQVTFVQEGTHCAFVWCTGQGVRMTVSIYKDILLFLLNKDMTTDHKGIIISYSIRKVATYQHLLRTDNRLLACRLCEKNGLGRGDETCFL